MIVRDPNKQHQYICISQNTIYKATQPHQGLMMPVQMIEWRLSVSDDGADQCEGITKKPGQLSGVIRGREKRK